MAIQYPSADAGPSRLPDYQLTQSLSAHERSITALKFSPDGRVLVSAGADGVLHLWESDTGDHIRSIRCHKRGINGISISSDGLYVATASDDCTSQIHSLHPLPSTSTFTHPTPKPLRHLKSHTAPVLCIAFSPKSNLIVTGSFDESAIVWDVRRGRVLRVLPAHAEAIWSVCWDSEGGMVVTGSADGLIRLWDANNGQCLKTLDNDTNSPVSFSTFTPSSFFLLSSTLASTIRLYNFHTAKVLKTLQAPGIYINDKHPCPAVVYEALPPSPSHPIPQSETAIDIDADHQEKNGANIDEHRIEDGNGNETELDMNGLDQSDERSRRRKRKEAWVIAGSENGKLVIWELESRRVIQVLGEGDQSVPNGTKAGTSGHRKPVVALAVHPNGRMIASGSLEPERVIHVWRDVN